MSIFTKAMLPKLKAVQHTIDDEHKFAAMIKFLERGIPVRYVEQFFESPPLKSVAKEYHPVNDSFYDETLNFTSQVLHPIVRNLSQWRSNAYNLMLYGPNGSGKTHAALYIMAQYISAGYETYYSTFKELYFLHNAATLNAQDNEEKAELYSQILDVDLLVIDELGKETLTEPVLSFLETIMKERFYNKKQTILITNLVVATESDGRKKDFLTRYGNSCWDIVRQGYQVYMFSKHNDFRAKGRIEWR